MARNKLIKIICIHCGNEDYKFSKRAVYCDNCVQKYGQDYLYYHHRMKGKRHSNKMKLYFANNPKARKKQYERVKNWMKKKDLV